MIAGDGARRGGSAIVTVLLMLLVTSCGGVGERGEALESWSVSPAPEVRIGHLEGDPAYTFGDVADARLLPDGGIAVADRQRHSVRVFGPDGALLRELGGEGAGPGEYRQLRSIWRSGRDTLRAWDSGPARITTYRLDGTLVRTTPVRPSGPEVPDGRLDMFAGTFGDGDPVLAWIASRRLTPDTEGPDRMTFGRFGPEGELEAILGEMDGLHRAGVSPALFTPFPYAAVADDRIYLTNGIGSRVTVRDGRGRVRDTLELPPSPHDPDEAWRALEERLRAEGDTSTLRRLRSSPRMDETPGLGGLLADDRGRLWVKDYDPARDAKLAGGHPWGPGGVWWVVDPEGTVVARVEMPEELVPLDIRGDRVLGLARGPLEVERIAVHRIRRPGDALGRPAAPANRTAAGRSPVGNRTVR